jgi:hypothetical protein
MKQWIIKEMSVADLKVAESNPREISNRNFQGLKNSIRRFGLVEPIIWNEKTGQIVGGHQRVRALVDAGITKTMVLVVDMEPEEAEAASLTMNNPAVEGEFDEPIGNLLAHLKAEDEALFNDLNMGPLQRFIENESKTQRGPLGGDDSGATDSESLTTCPCCGHKWEVTVEDVKVEKSGG